MVKAGDAKEGQSHDARSHRGSAEVSGGERGCKAISGGRSGADVGAYGDDHPERGRGGGAAGAQEIRQGTSQATPSSAGYPEQDPDHGGQNPKEKEKGHVLAEEISPRALLNEPGDGYHPFCAGILMHDVPIEDDCGQNSQSSDCSTQKSPPLPHPRHVSPPSAKRKGRNVCRPH